MSGMYAELKCLRNIFYKKIKHSKSCYWLLYNMLLYLLVPEEKLSVLYAKYNGTHSIVC